MRNLFWVAYLVIGIVVAADRSYFDHLGNVDNVASTIVAILVWPLILFGVDITVR